MIAIVTLSTLFLTLCIAQSFSIDSDEMVGVWELVKTYNKTKDEKYKPNKKIYFDFRDGGDMIKTDTGTRERVNWNWRVSKNKLTLTTHQGPVTGIIRMYKHTDKEYERTYKRFDYTFSVYSQVKVDGNRYKRVKTGTYIWTFEESL